MADIIVAGNTSGAITISAPLVAGSGTLTLPVATDTLVGKATTDTLTNKTLTSPTITGATITVAATAAPAFSAYMSSSPSWTTGVFTKVAINTEEFDTNNNFDSTTNYRFTPTVAGYYQVNGNVSFGNTAATGVGLVSLYKNGSEFKRANANSLNLANFTLQNLSTILYLNGSTDYIEFYGLQSSAGALTQNGGGAAITYFQAAMIRSA